MSYSVNMLSPLEKEAIKGILCESGFSMDEDISMFKKDQLRATMSSRDELKKYWGAAKTIIHYVDFSECSPSEQYMEIYNTLKHKLGDVKYIGPRGEIIGEPMELRGMAEGGHKPSRETFINTP